MNCVKYPYKFSTFLSGKGLDKYAKMDIPSMTNYSLDTPFNLIVAHILQDFGRPGQNIGPSSNLNLPHPHLYAHWLIHNVLSLLPSHSCRRETHTQSLIALFQRVNVRNAKDLWDWHNHCWLDFSWHLLQIWNLSTE